MRLDRIARRGVADRPAPRYSEPEADLLRMDANTNLIGLNPAVRRAADAALRLQQYPSPMSDDLRREIARVHGLSREHVIVGVGSDEAIDFVTKALLNPGDPIATPSPTFVMYSFYGRSNLGKVIEVPLRRPGFELDVEGLLKTRANVTIVASPNNPTGNAFPEAELERLVREAEGVVVIDEAYAEFCGQDFARRATEFENLIVLRTFSKAHGLAGLRVGYALGSESLIDRLYCVKPPFDVGTLSEAIAIEALRDSEFVRESVRVVREERERLAHDLTELRLRPVRSDANFLLVEVGDGEGARRFLADRKILTRAMSDVPGMEGFLRVTVGRREHNTRLVEGLAAWRNSR